MLDSLGGVLQYVAQTGQRREVNRYLHNATQESVLRDLLKALRRRKSEIRCLERIFDAHAHEDLSTKQRYWCEESLRDHIEKAHPHLTSSEGVVRLLWRCFHFYAFHPFPGNSTEQRIDLEAFQRAVTMLAAQGADLLGVIEDVDSFWRFDGDDLYNQAKLKRIFRSIGNPEKSTGLDDESKHILEETTDVLAMTQPFFMHNGPHEHQLTPTARRLLGEDLIRTRRRVTRKDFTTLLSVLVRLNFFEDNWGLSFPFGSFIPADPCGDELANILINALEGGHGQEELRFDQVNQIMHLLPNLYIRFYQMWAILFQPSMEDDSTTPTRVPNHISDPVLGSISLFIPHPVVSTLRELRGEHKRIALEDPIRLLDEEDGVAVVGIADALAKDTCPHILLVSGTDTATSESTVFGTYLPQESEGVTLHLFFQLRPRFRLIRWSCAQKRLVHSINIADTALSSKAAAIVHEYVEKNTPFYIGQSTGERNCIRVDPKKKVATLIVSRHIESPELLSHNYSDSNGMTGRENVEVTFSDMTLLRVSDSVATVAPGLINSSGANSLPGVIQESTEVIIRRGELRSRIVGFGSG